MRCVLMNAEFLLVISLFTKIVVSDNMDKKSEIISLF